MRSGIYMLRHVASGKVYVGSAVDIDKRFRAHQKMLTAGTHHSRKLQHSWSKYGETAFEWEVLEHCERAVLLVREQHYIELFDAASSRYGFNINPTAGNNLGRKFGPVTPTKRAIIIASNRRRKLSAVTRAKIGAANRGRKRTVVSEKQRAWARALGSRNRGRRLSAEQREVISRRLSGRQQSSGHIARRAAARRGRKFPEWSARMRAGDWWLPQGGTAAHMAGMYRLTVQAQQA